MKFKDLFPKLHASLTGRMGEGNVSVQHDEETGKITLTQEALGAHEKELSENQQKLQDLEDKLNNAETAEAATKAKETAESNLEAANNSIKDLRAKVDTALEEAELEKTATDTADAEAIDAGITSLKDEVARLGKQAGATPTKAKGEEDQGTEKKEPTAEDKKRATIQETIAKVQGGVDKN